MRFRSVAGHSSLATLSVALALGACAPVHDRPGEPHAAAPSGSARTAQPPAPTRTDAPDPGSTLGQTSRPGRLAGWPADDLDGLADAIDGQCALARPPAPWPQLCPEFRAQRTRLRAWLEGRFVARPLTGADGTSEGLITGYHEPEVGGSLRRQGDGQVPLYRRPSKAVLDERPTRARIEESTLLAGQELVWIDDPVDAFFLQIQGSGRVRLREGGVMRVGYAADNGQPYRAIGQVLIARGALEPAEVNAETIKAWLRAHPREAREVMQANPRFIFFRELPPGDPRRGPPGSLGVPLVPMRSVAVDPARVPAGTLLFLDTTDPLDGAPLRRVVVAQDTGAAIVGPVRADLFWGSGPRAERGAGLMKQRGRLWRLVPTE